MFSLLAFASPAALTIRLDHLHDHVVNTFIPRNSIGVGFDGHEQGEIEKILSPDNLAIMRSAGFQTLSYRLRTELGVEAWHWNPTGTWSSNGQGYWRSATTGETHLCYGYRLPRRGSTGDEANDDGYSRIDDGDLRSLWKSNPYLSKPFTHEEDSRHPQQVIVDFGVVKPIQEARIDWGEPYAADFTVEYWNGENSLGASEGEWKVFPHGRRKGSKGGREAMVLAPKPVRVRFVRIRMTKSSYTSDPPSADIRDRCGFAIREIAMGDHEGGRFVDHISHSTHGHQTRIFVSSTDPWHREEDQDPRTEHAGFDFLESSRITPDRAMLVSVPTLYGTPDEAGNLVQYLHARKIPVRGIELGEEPDGQFVEPEDFAALYIQVAQAIRKVDPKVLLGGPSLEEIQSDVEEFPHQAQASWFKRFYEALRARHQQGLLQFCSFEWYPYDSVSSQPWIQLQEMSHHLQESLADLGIPKGMPFLISEYGWSAFAAQAEVELEGGLMDADILGTSLTLGAKAAYLYGLEPSNLELDRPENGWGDNMLFLGNADRTITAKTARFWVSQLVNRFWIPSSDQQVRLYSAEGDGEVRVFPLRDSNGRWSIMILNEDPIRSKRVILTGAEKNWVVRQFGREQYQWSANGASGYPKRSLPPREFNSGCDLNVPAYSITVLRPRP